MSSLRVTVLEVPATWGDPGGVLAAVDTELERGPQTDLVLLPEASLTGYVSSEGDFDLSRFAEDASGPTATAIAEIAARRGVILVAPLVLREGHSCFNAVIAQGPKGERVFTYRKRHPWYPEAWATPGAEAPPIVRIGPMRVTIAICFDVHFLEEDGAGVLAESDLLLFPSAWVDPSAWGDRSGWGDEREEDETNGRAAILARLARSSSIAIANANWGAGIVSVPGQGGSIILDAGARVLARVDASTPGTWRADATLIVAS